MQPRLAHTVDQETGCWNWAKGRMAAGYGETWDGERVVYAHRVYYERYVGPIPDGFQIDHLCRNRACVNPEHLEPVTNAENARRGERTKLDWEKVRLIRSTPGVPQKEWAARFGVAPCSINHVLTGRTWAEGT